MLKKCFVPSCKNNSKDKKNKIFLTVPSGERRSLWFAAVGRKQEDLPSNRSIYCCEDHFKLEDDVVNWMQYKVYQRRLQLKENIVPHLNLEFPSAHEELSQLTDSAKKRKTDFIKDVEEVAAKRILLDVNDPVPSVSPFMLSSVEKTKRSLFGPTTVASSCLAQPWELSPSKSLDVVQQNQEVVTKSPSGFFCVTECATKDKAVQVNIKKEGKSHFRSVAIDATKKMKSIGVNTVTGEQKYRKTKAASETDCQEMSETSTSFSTASASVYAGESSSVKSGSSYGHHVEMMNRRVSTISLMEFRSRFYCGVPKNVVQLLQIIVRFAKVPYVDVLITLRKIRLNDVYSRLADDFEMSKSAVQKIFVRTVKKMANVMQNLVFWPTSEQIKKTLPIPFRARYRNVQSIIDCFEIQILKDSDAIKQTITWSEYKKSNTLKFLISSTPHGFVNFVSGGFGGKISDKEIVAKSGFLNVLPNEVDVMADRGFKQIDSMLEQKKCRLVRPPSVHEGVILSKELAKENKKIAALRIHIERIIRRLREFQMLVPHSCLHKSLWPLINHIVIICCAIINVQGPLINM